MIGTRIKINLVAFLVISLGLIFLMATQVLSILQARYSVYALFPDAGGVFTNQEVTYRGVTVGQVGEMKVIDEGVSIELLIREEFDEIPKEGIEARVMFKSAVGEQFVDLLPASDGAPYLEDGTTIPLEQNSIPVSTQELLATLEAVLRGVPPEALKGAVDSLGIGLTGRGHDIATIIESMADLADLFAERAPEVEGLLEEGTEVGSAFVASREDFERAIRELVTVSRSLSDNRENLKALLENTNFASDEVVHLLRTYRGNLDAFLSDFADVNELQAQHAGDLSQLFLHLPSALDRVVKSFEPKTGLVRFGLVNDNNAPACSYGTERRRPSSRDPQAPPRDAECGDSDPDRDRTAEMTASERAIADLLGAGGPSTRSSDVGAPRLPARMSDWSWSLTYLNSI